MLKLRPQIRNLNGQLRWLENVNGDGQTWSSTLIDNFAAVVGAFPADFDGDGTIDLVAHSTGISQINVYTNTAGGVASFQ